MPDIDDIIAELESNAADGGVTEYEVTPRGRKVKRDPLAILEALEKAKELKSAESSSMVTLARRGPTT